MWAALAEFFVGKELQDYDYRSIAAVLRDSGLPLSEMERILREEVAPVFGSNLGALTTVVDMEAWPRDVVRDRVLERLQGGRHWWQPLARRLGGDPLGVPILRDRWSILHTHLSSR
jgi:hypothetical protein